MVFEGKAMLDAATEAGMHMRALRKALEKPFVISHLRATKHVFRESISARNIQRLAEIRDAGNNMPAVNAIRMLEQMPDDAGVNGARNSAPGMVIQIINNGAVNPQSTIDRGHVVDNAEVGK